SFLRLRLMNVHYPPNVSGAVVEAPRADLLLTISQLRRMYPAKIAATIGDIYLDQAPSSLNTPSDAGLASDYVNAQLSWLKRISDLSGGPNAFEDWYGIVTDADAP